MQPRRKAAISNGLNSGSLLEIKDLSLQLEGDRKILSGFNLRLNRGEVHFLVGESGSGKTSLLMTILGLLDSEIRISYSKFQLFGEDLNSVPERIWRSWRGRRMVLIPQNPANSFHPYLSIGSQLMEFFRLKAPELARKKTILNFLEEAGISSAKSKWNQRPTSLSGGERQRLAITLGIRVGADLILADEPTTALDSVNEKSTLEFLYDLVKKNKISLLFITHDVRIVRALADTVTIIRSGETQEVATRSGKNWEFQSPYGKLLFSA